MIIEPVWLAEARKYIGVKEIPGPQSSHVIGGWLQRLRAWWKDDATPWCGVFVSHCIDHAGFPLPRYWMRAKDWMNWGESIAAPFVGAVVVFTREGGGHVGFVVGKDRRGNLMVLGGNQGDMVKVSPFSMARVTGFRVPKGYNIPAANFTLPVLASDGKLSVNEA